MKAATAPSVDASILPTALSEAAPAPHGGLRIADLVLGLVDTESSGIARAAGGRAQPGVAYQDDDAHLALLQANCLDMLDAIAKHPEAEAPGRGT